MKVSVFAYAAVLGVAFAGTALAQKSPPSDTGSMAYPAPVPQGNVGSTAVPGRKADTGSMAYPAPVKQGNTNTTATTRKTSPTDTGSMAYPAPLPQGNLETTRVK